MSRRKNHKGTLESARTVSDLARDCEVPSDDDPSVEEGAAGIFEFGSKADAAASIADDKVLDLHAKIGELRARRVQMI